MDRLPDGLGEGERIEQGYLAIGDDGVEVRVRRRGDDMTLTIKSGPGMMRTEEELGDRRAALRVAVAADRGPAGQQDAPPHPARRATSTAELDVY